MKNCKRELDYVMSKEIFKSYLATRNAEEKKENPYSYVIKVINNEFNLNGVVKHLKVN